MTPYLFRFGPLMVLLSVAGFCCWPPAEPLDLGGAAIATNQVSWKPADLTPKVTKPIERSPFEIFGDFASGARAIVQTVQNELPEFDTSMSREQIAENIHIQGTATVRSRKWAMINDEVCRPGDTVTMDERFDEPVTLVSIDSSRIVLSVGRDRITFSHQGVPID